MLLFSLFWFCEAGKMEFWGLLMYNGFVIWFFYAAAQLPPRYYVGHSIYKGKAALTVEPRGPEFTALDVCLIIPFILLKIIILECSII